eukprot:m.14094 g.14094  ORF g.14094 m.14094 type:complete len:65 (-) comp8284_c0_seq1:1095-1289(-)
MTVIVVRCEVGDTSESRDEISEQRAISFCARSIIHMVGFMVPHSAATFVFSVEVQVFQIPNPKK